MEAADKNAKIVPINVLVEVEVTAQIGASHAEVTDEDPEVIPIDIAIINSKATPIGMV